MFHGLPNYGFDGLANMRSVSGPAAIKPGGSGRAEIEMMRFDIERLLMITEALWDILKEKHGFTDEELIERVTEIDRRDGKLDGRVAPQPPSSCPRCGRVLERKRPYCLYCGQAIALEPFER